MAKAREQTCTMSHQAGRADCVWAHSHSWALRVMNTVHGKGTQHCTWPHFQLPLTALGSYWHLRPFWLDPHPACQTGKAGPCQNTPCSWTMGAADLGKDLARVEVKPSMSTLEAPSCYTPELLGKECLLLRQTRAQFLLVSQSMSALFPYQNSLGSFGECKNRSSLLQQNMRNTKMQNNNRIKNNEIAAIWRVGKNSQFQAPGAGKNCWRSSSIIFSIEPVESFLFGSWGQIIVVAHYLMSCRTLGIHLFFSIYFCWNTNTKLIILHFKN